MYGRDRKVQGEIRGRPKRCEVADESVVVMKSRPVKSGNSMEGKTGTTWWPGSPGTGRSQKPYQLRRDEVYLKFL